MMKVSIIATIILIGLLIRNRFKKKDIPFLSIVERYADSVPIELILAIIKVESDFNPMAVGIYGEYGLMQIKCETARDMGFTGNCSELFEPATNIKYGVSYLIYQYNRYNSWTAAISAYNAGHLASNTGYVNSVLKWWQYYRERGLS